MKMFVDERRNKILHLLNKNKRVTVKYLAKEINVSEVTLRADLNNMEQKGLLTRTHGGAILNNSTLLKEYSPTKEEKRFSYREQKNKKEKEYIAERAFTLIEERQCILLDASSTALELARYIKNQSIQLTVVTTGLQSALELNQNSEVTVILIGGLVSKTTSSIESTLGSNILDHVKIDTMFTSANGFSLKNGLSDFNLYEVELKKEITLKSDNLVALIDHSKLNKDSNSVFASLNQIDKIVSNKPLGQELATNLKRKNIKVIV